MIIAVGTWTVDVIWLVVITTLIGLFIGGKLAARYWRVGPGSSPAPSLWRRARALGIVAIVGAVGWSGGVLLGDMLGEPAPTLPQATYLTLDGEPFVIRAGTDSTEKRESAGAEQAQDVSSPPSATSTSTGTRRSTVVNLWASWCGPCRREMPAFLKAQAQHPKVRFIYANQGETAITIRAFLTQQNLSLKNVILDPDRSWMTRFHASGIPTTLFFDADGKLVSSQVGELSDAALKDQLTRLERAP